MPKRATLYPDPFPYADYRRYTYAMGIATGDVIWVAGHLADEYDPEIRHMVCRGGLIDQTKLALEKARLVMRAGGAESKDIVHQVDYITPAAVKEYPKTLGVRREFFGGDLPVTTTVVVNKLLREESLIEVEVVGVKGSSPGEIIGGGDGSGRPLPAPRAVKKGNLLFMTAGPSAGGGNVAVQAQAAYESIGEALRAAGMGPNDVVRSVDYITPSGLADYKDTAQVRRELFGEDFPAATGIIMEGLPGAGALIEVSVMAVAGGGNRRAFNPGWARYDRLTFRPGVGKGDLVCLSGLVGADPVTRNVAKGDLGAQTRTIYQQAVAILNEAGLSMKSVVKTVDYITPDALASYRDTVPVRREFFGQEFPVSTGVIVNRLLRPECLIEIDFTAAAD